MPCLCNLLNDNLIWLVLIALIILYFCNYDSSDCGCNSCGCNR